MQDIKVFKQSELVLKVEKYYDPKNLNLNEWEMFLDVLCGNRDYQKEAIRKAIIFMASGEYESTEDLIIKNYRKNTDIQAKYPSINDYMNNLQISKKFHANIDLATGTGKSYVIYGIAQIMLGLGLVKKVLVLCPSTTIEKGLTKKFTNLASMSELRDTIPENAEISNPSIIDANQTIEAGDICVENIHAVYENTGSSITDSFKMGGADTLILNDEAHHIYNEPQSINGKSKEGKDIKRWKEFLINNNYNFRYILGFTGTPYINNEYFNDIIYRYSLRDAIDDKVVKSIEYVQEDDSSKDLYEKFQKIYHNHQENIRKNPSLKPLTIMVTKDIINAENLKEDLIDFLAKWEKMSIEEVEKKILIVTSDDKHKANLRALDYVDDRKNLTEWIISVSMLTEGWDVKNVFQIVPWEDRAFNSKLLIAQVLGRGLRIPESYIGTQPSVIVFNHDNWSKNIKNLVDEVLEIETRIRGSVRFDGDRNKFNFGVHNITYNKSEIQVNHNEDEKILNYSKSWSEGIKLVSQTDKLKKGTSYESISNGNLILRDYEIEQNLEHLDAVVNKVMHAFKTRDWEGGILGLGDDQVYHKDKLPSKEKIKELVKNSMEKVGIEGNYLTEENSHKIFKAFSTLFRISSKTVIQKKISEAPYKIQTEDMSNGSIALSSLRRGSTVFYSNDFKEVVDSKEQEKIFVDFLKDNSFLRSSSQEINKYVFKTPLNFVFTTDTPEYEFVKKLCDDKNANKMEAWIKSRDRGFYQIEYSYRVSNHQRQRQFNPDFFIKYIVDGEIVFLVVEIKVDKDDSIENKAKYKYAKLHFEELNEQLRAKDIKERYIFHFLSPKDYQTFFQYVEDGRVFEKLFRSELENMLDE